MLNHLKINKNLNVFFVNSKKDKSVSVFDSDSIGNLLHMEALVSTLVKDHFQVLLRWFIQ
jgi:hypothetical protein